MGILCPCRCDYCEIEIAVEGEKREKEEIKGEKEKIKSNLHLPRVGRPWSGF
jgi:hypothetical protein